MLRRYAEQLNITTKSHNDSKVSYLEQSGYVVVEDQVNKLIIDTAKVGPDYILVMRMLIRCRLN